MRLVGTLVISAFAVVVGLAQPASQAGDQLHVTSPSGALDVTVRIDDRLTYAVSFKGAPLVSPSPISMTLQGGEVLGSRPKVARTSVRKADSVLRPVVRVKRAEIPDRYNERRIDFAGDYSLLVRVFDDGVAWRFETRRAGGLTILAEEASFHFAGNPQVFFPEDTSLISHQERPYKRLALRDIKPGQHAYTPVLVVPESGPKVAITEADLLDYSGMSVTAGEPGSLKGLFSYYPAKTLMDKDRTERVIERADYIARTRGTRAFPWRVLAVAERDADLLETEVIYRLASDTTLKDTSWIRPGKVAWDWWNANNLYGVPFRAGVNTDTYKHFIDFAAEHGIEYVILDEGWYQLGDLTRLAAGIDMEAISAHARQRGVGLIMWVVWKTFDDQMDAALDLFRKWGVKGIKVDFMQREDQWMVNYYERVAKKAAERQLLVDFHGAYKPTGLIRTYPNVLTSEGILGLEHNKWSTDVTPDHNVTFPFMRMLAGPADYTPGAMMNATQASFSAIFNRPMSQGTRCHQLAMYVVYESPLQMLADSPSNYKREPDSLSFLSTVPAVWDETRVLDARVGEYILTARRRGQEWYVGAMTNWSPRSLELDLSFLGPGRFSADIHRDGPNADRAAIDYVRERRNLASADKLTIQLAAGGGWVARVVPAR